MKKNNTEKQIQAHELEKTKITIFFVWMGLIMFVAILGMNVFADEIKFQFKSPSFSGIGQSAHYITV